MGLLQNFITGFAGNRLPPGSYAVNNFGSFSAAGAANSFTHGLGTAVFAQVSFQCTTADLGYSIGDRVYNFDMLRVNGNNGSGILPWISGASAGYACRTTSDVYLPNKSTGVFSTLDPTAWDIILTAFKDDLFTFIRGALDDDTQDIENTGVLNATASWGAYEFDVVTSVYDIGDYVFPGNDAVVTATTRAVLGTLDPGSWVGLIHGGSGFDVHPKTGGSFDSLSQRGWASYSYLVNDKFEEHLDAIATGPAGNRNIGTNVNTDKPVLVWAYFKCETDDEGYTAGELVQAGNCGETTGTAVKGGALICVEPDGDVLRVGTSTLACRVPEKGIPTNQALIDDTNWSFGARFWW